MACNWIGIWLKLEVVVKVVAILVILCFPITGSRSIGGNLGSGSSGGGVLVTFDPPPTDIAPEPQPLGDEELNVSTDSSGGGTSDSSGSNDSSSSSTSATSSINNPCALVSMSLLDEKDGMKLMSYEEKSLLTISHHVFEVSHGIVPNILYKVDLEIPSGHEYSLEYWMNGVVEDRKRRHQRDHRDVLELYFNSSSRSTPEQVIFCSKSSLGGENKDTSSISLSFNWFINGNNIIVPASSTSNGLPTSIVFRLRFRSIVEKTSSVFEQNLSVIVRPDCYLVLKILSFAMLSLSSLWNPETDNKGINCTVLLLPRTNFGLEIRIVNFSIYGMRDICKGRYVSFSQPKSHKTGEESVPPSLMDPSNEFPMSTVVSQLERKFCGKLEDYNKGERLLTFSSDSSLSSQHSTSPNLHSPFVGNDNWRGGGEKAEDTIIHGTPSSGILLHVNLPAVVKPRETFLLKLSSLNPCQRVSLIDLDGEVKYSRNYGNDECSIVIHVPYGNKLITKMTLSRLDTGSGSGGDPDQNSRAEYSESNSIAEDVDTNYNGNNNSINYYNYNDSDLDFESLENTDNSVQSYECPVNIDVKSSLSDNARESNGSGGGSPGASDATRTEQYMFIKAEDLVSGSEFMWCFDGSSNPLAQHKRAWKSSGNKVKISFELKHFDVFHLTYQSIKVPELTGECDRGWVKVDGGCVTLVEKLSTWTKAEEFCQLKNGHLATISGESDESHIQKIITQSALFLPSRAYWIGANDRESEGNFQWASGLPFSYKNWFMGWFHKRNEILNAQPNDDGWSGQDCVEIRQILNSHQEKSTSLFPDGESRSSTAGKPRFHNSRVDSRFYWNDRNCEAKNFYICERTTQQTEKELSCNRTLQINPPQTTTLAVTSPAYPTSYPENTVCVTNIEAPPGYKIVVSFDEFILEESPSCQYDSLEISETQGKGVGDDAKNRVGVLINMKKICGDWTKKLKLLRYVTRSSRTSTTLSLKFESDFSHQFAGFKAKVWVEKDVSEQCSDQQMKKFGSHCYLTVSFPAVNWVTAQQICSSLQAKLASVLSIDEWNFLTRYLTTVSGYDRKSSFWIGGSIDQNSQLVWSDRMPFNFSAFHSSDLQTISEWKCLKIYWFDVGKGDFAWRLADCNQLSGYVCKKQAEVEVGHKTNRTTFSGGGKESSPNYPSTYYNNLDYTYNLVAPRGTQIVIRFSHLDIEEQEDCLYDYLELVDKKTNNSTRFCGSYSGSDLEKLDYVSSSNEVNVIFHTDFSEAMTGFEIVWRAVDVTGCISGKTILAGLGGNGFSIHEATIHTPNFPYFNLPHLDCVYTIVAPAGQRIWLNFQVFELGDEGIDGSDCTEQDHVAIDLETEEKLMPLSEKMMSDEKKSIILCGNLTSVPHRTSFVSIQERIRIRVVSPKGKSGRGFLGRFKAIPGQLVETLTVGTTPNTTSFLTSINYPMSPAPNSNITVAFSSPPNYILAVNINGTTRHCREKGVRSFLEIRDPYHGINGTTWRLCHSPAPPSASSEIGSNGERRIILVNDNLSDRMGRNEISLENSQMSTPFSFRSTFNRLDIRQVYLPGFTGRKWMAQIVTSLDENYRAKLLANGDGMMTDCINNPCGNGGSCVTSGGKHICRCPPPFTGPFCGLSLCDLNPCLFGECILTEKSIRCVCQLGYGGERCDRRMKPCDDNPCLGHGECVEVNKTSYRCMCHAWWEGPQCESRMLVIPYKPLSQRMLEEPFWLGLITVTVVLGVIGLIWCLKRHFPEKLEKLLNEDLDKNRGISWVSGRSPSSFRAGGGSSLGIREPIPGTSQQAVSPPPSRSFLGRFGIRKPSLLSLSSATSNVSVAAVSPHTYENRTFSLDDLLRPSRSMMRTPSPHRRRNYSVQVRRDPAEKQQILQQLVSAGGSTSLDGENKPSTPKPTLAEIIQMSEKRLRLASASSMASEPGCSTGGQPEASPNRSSLDTEETSFSLPPPSTSTNSAGPSAAAIKAEKKVTFARMLDKLAPVELLSSSSSLSDVSCAEDTKMVVVAPKPPGKKERKGRFRRSKAYHRGRNSETDQDYMDISSSDTTPDPICPPRFPTRLCISPTNLGNSGSPTSVNPSLSLSATGGGKGSNPKIPKIGSADSLLALFRRFSGTNSNSAPPSPQYSENEESSTGATPLSTPSSPRNSLLSLSIRPPAFHITTAPSPEPNNTIELPVIDPFTQNQGWRAPPATSITLEVPMRDYCLSPIHEVPTPAATPSHSPCHTPMMRRPSTEALPSIKIHVSSEDDDGNSSARSSSGSAKGSGSGSGGCHTGFPKRGTPPLRRLEIPVISISVEGEEDEGEIDADDNAEETKEDSDDDKHTSRHFHFGITGESEVIPDVLIHVPPDACVESQPEETLGEACGSVSASSPDCISSPRVKSKPPPLVFANEILSYQHQQQRMVSSGGEDEDRNVKIVVPLVSIEYATPVSEALPKFISSPLQDFDFSPGDTTPKCPSPPCRIGGVLQSKDSPLAPPMITINQSSEAESDSDTPAAHRHLHRPNLCFLSPFAGTSDRVPSESNLSTSGYSSMASPCPSRCPSVSPLCPSEAEDYHSHCTHSGHNNHHRRSSLTPGTPKKPMTPRRCSLNAPQIASGLLCDNSDKLSEKNTEEVEIETDSAVEVETDFDCQANMSEVDAPPLTPVSQKPNLSMISEEMKSFNSLLLHVPKKGMPKSRSLDINAYGQNAEMSPSGIEGEPSLSDMKFDKKNYLRSLGPSLDSKLNSIDPTMGGSSGVTITFPLSNSMSNLVEKRKSSNNLIEIPEEKERRLSPVSSRSESPLSELSAAGCFNFFGSPLTDSDGVYDCGSSEVPANNNETDTTNGAARSNLLSLSRLNPGRRSSGRKKDRRMIKQGYKLSLSPTSLPINQEACEPNGNPNVPVWSVSTASPEHPTQDAFVVTGSPNLELPPSTARDGVHNVVGKRSSPKRRVRAQPNLDGSSSSSESCVSSRPRSRTSVSSAQNSRNTSPLPMSQGASSVLSPSDRSCEIGKRSSISPLSPTGPSRPFVSQGGTLQEGVSLKPSSVAQDGGNDESDDKDASTKLSRSVPTGSSRDTGLSPGRRKISRLRAISHQIRFLRRLEMSLIRKKECLTQVSKGWPEEERRESILSHTDSAEDSSRYDTSDSTSLSSESLADSNSDLLETEKPLLGASASEGKASGSGSHRKRQNTKISPLNVLESISARDFLTSNKKKMKKYK